MRLTLTIPKAGPLPELHVFSACGAARWTPLKCLSHRTELSKAETARNPQHNCRAPDPRPNFEVIQSRAPWRKWAKYQKPAGLPTRFGLAVRSLIVVVLSQ